MNYDEMTIAQRAAHLLSIGVTAQVVIETDSLTPVFAAWVVGFGRLPCGGFTTEQQAVEAGLNWLRRKAGQLPQPSLKAL